MALAPDPAVQPKPPLIAQPVGPEPMDKKAQPASAAAAAGAGADAASAAAAAAGAGAGAAPATPVKSVVSDVKGAAAPFTPVKSAVADFKEQVANWTTVLKGPLNYIKVPQRTELANLLTHLASISPAPKKTKAAAAKQATLLKTSSPKDLSLSRDERTNLADLLDRLLKEDSTSLDSIITLLTSPISKENQYVNAATRKLVADMLSDLHKIVVETNAISTADAGDKVVALKATARQLQDKYNNLFKEFVGVPFADI